jgi:hypothetical protein
MASKAAAAASKPATVASKAATVATKAAASDEMQNRRLVRRGSGHSCGPDRYRGNHRRRGGENPEKTHDYLLPRVKMGRHPGRVPTQFAQISFVV